MMRRIVFLCSGGGGNLRFVVQALKRGVLGDASVRGVLTDRECLANRYARDHGIPTDVLDFSGDSQSPVIAALDALAPDLVVTNVHKILSVSVVTAYRGRLVNLHYSLLPAYGGVIGARPVEMALADGAQFLGVTAHHVEVAVDAGRPIVQAIMPTEPGDTAGELMDTVFRCGCLALLQAIASVLRPANATGGVRDIQVHGRDVRFNPLLSFGVSSFDEAFWRDLAAYPAAPI
ncbi:MULTISPECIES: phosphoribosylglycinamide formyltransferase [unclassified Cupriavidus]|uniref:phosphoribosylglycinamide formyltransferase n=1 Tax=Cupriavidus sp. H19C3 TaxID=3241603 RepID=UPI003BF7C471